MQKLIILCAMMLVGCSSGGDRAAQAYEIADNPEDRCREATRAKNLYLDEGDDPSYQKWSQTAASDCLRASLERR